MQRTTQQGWVLHGKDTTVVDCDGVSRAGAFLLLGNGRCDINLNCEALSLDGGDCNCPLETQRVTVVISGVKVAETAMWGMWGDTVSGSEVQDWHSMYNEMVLSPDLTVRYTECWQAGQFQLSVSNTAPGWHSCGALGRWSTAARIVL